MRVKIGDTIHDAELEPIMLILTDQDKRNIANMAPDATMICQFPNRYSIEEIDKWMGPSPTGREIEEMPGG